MIKSRKGGRSENLRGMGRLVKGVVFYILTKSHPYSASPDGKVSQYLAEIYNLLLLFSPQLFQTFRRHCTLLNEEHESNYYDRYLFFLHTPNKVGSMYVLITCIIYSWEKELCNLYNKRYSTWSVFKGQLIQKENLRVFKTNQKVNQNFWSISVLFSKMGQIKTIKALYHIR